MEPEEKYPSPAGHYVFRIYPWEARMSQWVETPELVEAQSRNSILRFRDSNWSLDGANWTGDSTVVLHLRKYPGNHRPADYEVCVSCERCIATIGTTEFCLSDLESRLDELVAAS